MGSAALAATPAAKVRNVWDHNQATLNRAIAEFPGGSKKFAAATDITDEHLEQSRTGQDNLDADLCPNVELALSGAVRCEDLRSDLHWFRDGSGHPIGYAKSVRDDDMPAFRIMIQAQPGHVSQGDRWYDICYGAMHVLDEEQVSEVVKCHGLKRADMDGWTAKQTDAVVHMVQSIVFREVLGSDDDIGGWDHLIHRPTHRFRELISMTDAEKIVAAVNNITDMLLPGMAAVHEFQWVAMDNDNGGALSKGAPRDVAVMMAELTRLLSNLINLKDHMQSSIREMEG